MEAVTVPTDNDAMLEGGHAGDVNPLLSWREESVNNNSGLIGEQKGKLG
jgi:hypothetical protein